MKKETTVVYNENSLDSKLTTIMNDIAKISSDVKSIKEDTNEIKQFIGFIEDPSDANPDIHRKFNGLFTRVDKLEHFRTHVNTGTAVITFIIGISIAIYAYL